MSAPPAAMGSSPRRRLMIGVAVGCVLVAGAIIAGALGSQARDAKATTPATQVMSDNILESLVTINPVLPVPPAKEQEAATPTATTTTTTTPAVEDGMATGTTEVPMDAAATADSIAGGLGSALGGMKDFLNSQTADKAPAPAPAGSLTTGGWAGLGGRNTICYPKNGTEVVTMVDGKSPCTVIVLTRSGTDPYNIRQQMNVTSTKIIVGNPIDMPALNASKIERLFYVGPGGRLDVRAVVLYKGGGRKLDEGRLKLTIGAVAYVALGGSFTATGCLIREQRQTLEQVLEESRHILDWRSRNLGGALFVAGGDLYLQGVTFLRVRPYGNFVINNIQVGRDLLVIAGSAVLSGCYNLNVNLFAQNVVVGNTIAVLGGTGVWAGGATCNVAGAQAQWGAGIQMFVAGGALVNAGFNYISVNGALMRGAFGLFSVGGGVHIQTGYLQSRAWIVGSINNAGQTFSVGGGIHQMVGGAIGTSSVSNVFFGAGGTAFVGSGHLRWIGVVQGRDATAQSNYGVGMVMYNGAGMTNFIYVAQASAQVARAQFGLGNDIFNGAGWHTSVNTTRYAAQLANAFYGEGNQIWIGAGGAVFIRCYTTTRRGVGFSSTRNLYTVAGVGISRTQGQRNIFVSKNGQYLLPFQPTPKRVLQETKEIVRPLTSAEESSLLRNNDVAAQLMGETAECAGGNTFFFSPEGRSKLMIVDTYMSEGEQQIVEDPALFQAKLNEAKSTAFGGGFAKMLAERGDLLGGAAKVTPGGISVNNTDCFLCGVKPGTTDEHMSGPGSCQVSDACANSDSPIKALESAQAAVAASGSGNAMDLSFPGASAMPKRMDDGSVELPDIFLLWHELVVYCRSTDPAVPNGSITEGCLSANYIKQVVRAFLGPEHADEYQLAVASAGIHDAVKPAVDAELQQAMSPEWNAECEGWTKYNIYMTANDQAVEDYLVAQWAAIVAEPADFEDTLLHNADASAKVKPCSIAVKRVGAAKYPSIKNMKGFKPMSQGLTLAGPSVTLASDSAITPIGEIREGETYKVFVQNFMKGAKINVQMVKGLDRTGPVVATIDSFEDGGAAGNGITELQWTAPAGFKAQEKEGAINKYYLMAYVESFPALFANSQAFTIAK